MTRRDFIVMTGAAAVAWPLAARAAQTTMPVIGVLSTATPETRGGLDAYRRGLADAGYVEGENVAIEYRYADFQYEKLPMLAEELVGLQVALIIVGTTASLVAAKAATQTIPVVFTIGSDPIESGFVPSLKKPGGNLTGVFTLNFALASKRLEMLREVVPKATTFAFLTNPSSPKFAEAEITEVQNAARILGLKLLILEARGRDTFEAAFAAAARQRVGGFVIGSEGLFINSPEPLVALADRYQMPAIYADDKPVIGGGLISYGADQDDGSRLVGLYAGKILKGDKPSDTPIQQSTKTRLLINLKAAKALALSMPPTLLARADQVIE